MQGDSDIRDHYFDSKFEVTSIVPENVEQVENFLIDEMNQGFQFFYQVETLEAPMVICGDAEIRLQEIFEEEIQEDQYWTDMAKNHGIVPLVNVTSMPEDDAIYTSFYFINNRKFIAHYNQGSTDRNRFEPIIGVLIPMPNLTSGFSCRL